MRQLFILSILLAATVTAWIVWVHPDQPASQPGSQVATIWTCSMHPQIRVDKPGVCPLCGMDLIPTKPGQADDIVRLDARARQIASIEVAPVSRKILHHEIRTVGRIEPAEPKVAHLTARFNGRIERLYADFTGTLVAKGDHLADIFSPDLIVAQQDLLQSTGPAQESSREKLRVWGIMEDQIKAILSGGKPIHEITLHAPIGGTVLEKSIRQGMYVEEGDPLYTVADLSEVWLYADIYEYELPWISVGLEARVEVEGAPGRKFGGTVAFVEPRVQESTRTVRVRLNLDNPDLVLKPGMFAKVFIHTRLGGDGMKGVGVLAGKYACPMHPEVAQDTPGSCPLCGMDLVKNPEPPASTPKTVYTCDHHGIVRDEPGICELCGSMKLIPKVIGATSENPLAIPVSAVLDTGTRRIVYIEVADGEYMAREVTLGPRAGADYPVLDGITEGERVVVQGHFLLDSQSQIEGKPSLMLPKGTRAPEPHPPTHEGHSR
ncbi:MAG: efflux RND transporter periplasmic adaptor subunit [Planctomycetota bacterium]